MDVHVRSAITGALNRRGVDVLTSQTDGTTRHEDPELLDRAMALERVLFSQDADLLREAARRQRSGVPFFGVVYAHQLKISDRDCIEDLETLAKIYEPSDIVNRVVFLPL